MAKTAGAGGGTRAGRSRASVGVNMSLSSYENEAATRAMKKYGLSRTEYNRKYPAGARKTEYVSAVREAAKRGEQLSARTLDDLARNAGEGEVARLGKFTPKAIPEGYMLPSARQAQRTASAAYGKPLRAQRSAGKTSQLAEQARAQVFRRAESGLKG